MECLIAQGLISDALDRAPLDAQQLVEAKEHCKGCTTCSAFVRTLLLARSASTPQPPADLVDRVMAAVRAEDAEERRTIAAALADMDSEDSEAVTTDTVTELSGSSGGSGEPLTHLRDDEAPLRLIRRWIGNASGREALVWASAAVVIAIAVGVSTSVGVRMITTSPQTATRMQEDIVLSAESPAPATSAAPKASDSAAGALQTAAPAGSYVTAQEVVYALSGPSSIATSGLIATGTVTTGFGGEPIKSVPAFTSADPDRLYLFDDTAKQLLVFNRVVRSYAGTQYQLTSSALSNYGQWPSLPPNLPAPTGADGSPTFAVLTTDPSGTQIYTLAARGAESGIAIGPGSAQSDPAAGNPNWTWWVPVR